MERAVPNVKIVIEKLHNLQNNGQGESVSKGMLLTDEDRALLLKVSNLLEELILK